MKKVFSCIFTNLRNEHLTKDIGQIGDALADIAPVKPYLVCYGNPDLPSLKTEAKNQSIYSLKDLGRFIFLEKAILGYLKKEGKKIDILHIQQFNKEDIYYTLWYKLINPNGKIFLKMDMNVSDLEKGIVYSKKKLFDIFHKFFEKKALRKIDLIALDSHNLLSEYKKKYSYIEGRLALFSHNLNDKFLAEKFPRRKSFEEKENIILTTGRIGAGDKNYEMLLKTIPFLDLEGWRVIFVGKVYNNFNEKVDQLLEEYPQLKGKIELTGQIDDRETLYSYYDRSKIFCLTSILETFGVAYIEALYFGNYIVGTDGMTSFDFISNKEELGKKLPVNDVDQLAGCLNNLIQNENNIASIAKKAHEHIAKNFYLSKNIQLLKRLID